MFPTVLFISKGELKFSLQNIGQNKLDTYMKRMFVAAGIDVSNRKITGHSGKRTMMSTIYNAGFDDHMVNTKSLRFCAPLPSSRHNKEETR